MDIELQTTEITTEPIELTTPNVEVCTGDEDIELVVTRKEFNVVGDSIYIGNRIDDTPQWLVDYIDSLNALSLDNKVNEINGLSESLEDLIDAMNVAKNAYTSAIITYEELETMVNAKIETLNSTLSGADATIINLLSTKVTPTEAQAITTSALQASINDGEISALIGSVQEAIANESGARATEVDVLTAQLEGFDDTYSTALTGLEATIEMQGDAIEAQAIQFTNLSTEVYDGGTTWASADSTLENSLNTTISDIKSVGLTYKTYATIAIFAYSGPYIPANNVYPTYALRTNQAVYILNTATHTYELADFTLPSITSNEVIVELVNIDTGRLGGVAGIANQYTYQLYFQQYGEEDARYLVLNTNDMLIDRLTNAQWLIVDGLVRPYQSYIDTKTESKFEYTSVLDVNELQYITGFGLQSEIDVTSGTLTKSSTFTVQADKFKLIDPVTENLATMTSDGLAFYKAGEANPYKMVGKIDVGTATNGETVTLTGFYKTPKIIVSPNSLRSYSASYNTQNQRWALRAENIQGSTTTGIWTFMPVASLTLDAAVSSTSLAYTFSGSNDTVYSTNYTSPSNTTSISLSGSINSYRSTGTAGTYQKRKCVCTLQTSINGGSTWSDANSTTIYHGADTGIDTFNLYAALTSGIYTYRVKAVFSDDIGTFTTGTTYDYYTRTVTSNLYNFDYTHTTNTLGRDTLTTTSYTLLPSEEVVSGTFSYTWENIRLIIPASVSIPGYNDYVEVTSLSSYSEILARFEKDSNSYPVWTLVSGSNSGTRTVPTTSTSKSVYIDSWIAGVPSLPNETIRCLGTIGEQTLTLQTRIPKTESTTATNIINNLNASFALSSATVLDSTGTMNYMAISY